MGERLSRGTVGMTGSADVVTPAAIVPLPPTGGEPAQAQGWRYDTRNDEMTSKPIRWALLRSENEIRLDSPYGGAQRGRLQVRQHPRHGLDVLVSVERGQILCDISDGCRYPVRFDDGAPQLWTFSEPADHSSEMLFVRDSEAFLRKLRTTKVVTIELQFFQSGPRTLTFNTADLKWE